MKLGRIFFFLALASSAFLASSTYAKTTTLRILTENWPPVSYEENGKAQGMAVELVQTIQKNIDSKTVDGTVIQTIEVVPWVRGYKFLQDVPNTLLFTVIRTPEREKLFTMLGPVARGNISIFAMANEKANAKGKVNRKFASIEEMKAKAVIAVTRGTAFETTIQNLKFKNIMDVRDTETSVRLLTAGRVDLICDDMLTIQDLLRKLSQPVSDVKSVVVVEKYELYLGFSPGTDPRIVSAWKRSLELIKKNGQYAALYRKWFPDLKPPTNVEVIGLAATSP